MPPCISGNVRAGAVEPRVNNAVKFLYSLGPALRGGCQLYSYYLSKKRFAGLKI